MGRKLHTWYLNEESDKMYTNIVILKNALHELVIFLFYFIFIFFYFFFFWGGLRWDVAHIMCWPCLGLWYSKLCYALYICNRYWYIKEDIEKWTKQIFSFLFLHSIWPRIIVLLNYWSALEKKSIICPSLRG